MDDLVLYEQPADAIARVVLNRPMRRNAQDTDLLYALNDALDRAATDDAIKVVILAARGDHFSAGHDVKEADYPAAMARHPTVLPLGGFDAAGARAQYAREQEIYTGFCERWRNLPKPTIAAVQGACIAGGLMLAWPCDLIVASADAVFMDNTVGMGVGGAEYFVHPWELGVRKAKELLFTGDTWTAEEAHRLGMVNHVVERDRLEDFTLELAGRIARKPAFALQLVKEAINAAEDGQGRLQAIKLAFGLHHLAHSHNRLVHGDLIDPGGVAGNVGRVPLAMVRPGKAK
ncbi:MAG: enoyl-CoA hydratase [Proteobacteria bacterium]|nr:enoyl-CoA hydratase [Pseudomonadota bacterium]